MSRPDQKKNFAPVTGVRVPTAAADVLEAFYFRTVLPFRPSTAPAMRVTVSVERSRTCFGRSASPSKASRRTSRIRRCPSQTAHRAARLVCLRTATRSHSHCQLEMKRKKIFPLVFHTTLLLLHTPAVVLIGINGMTGTLMRTP